MLATFFRRVVIAALPLAAAGCGGGGDCGTPVLVSVDGGGFSDAFTFVPVYDGGPEVFTNNALCQELCPPALTNCRGIVDGGQRALYCQPYPCHTGRRPAGLASARPLGESAAGRWWAAVAHLEAASVPAFRALADDLARHGAPAHLVAACERSALDEVRHARLATALAARHGAAVPEVEAAPPAPRDLVSLAIDNAVEGGARETFGALVATWQARAARDRDARAAMTAIAADETRHAELAWELHAWMRGRLSAAARARVEAAHVAAVVELAATLDAVAEPQLTRAAGLPSPEVAHALYAAFRSEVARRV